MADTNDLFGLNPRRFALGVTTTAYAVTLQAGQAACAIKLISGGTLELVNGSTPAPTGLGWPIQSEVLGLDMRGTLYFAVSGATCVFSIITGKTAGYSDLGATLSP